MFSTQELAVDFGSDFGPDFGNMLSSNNIFDLASLPIEVEVEDSLHIPRMMNEDVNSGNLDLVSPASLPLSTAYFASVENSIEPESQEYEKHSSIGRPSSFFSLDGDEAEKLPTEGSSFLKAGNLINAVTNGIKSEQGTAAGTYICNERLCCCSTALNILQLLCFHPALSQQNGRPSLDFVLLLLEDHTNQLYAGVLKCPTCRAKTLHSLISLCVCADWIIDMLKRSVQPLSSNPENVPNNKARINSPKRDSSMFVGKACLDDQLQQACVRGLLKHRISRLAAVISAVARLGCRGSGSLEEAFRVVIKGVLCKIELLLGMIEVEIPLA